MSGYVFRRDPLEAAVEAWRPVDRALLRWVRAHGGSERLATTAAWASLADGDGDTALPLRDAAARLGMPPLSASDLASLRDEPMVGDGSALTPFVIDDADRFYLTRNHRDEVAVADAVRRLRAQRNADAFPDDALEALFAAPCDAGVAAQREAVCRAAGRGLFVLTGGPGTGKTTTVLRMLLMMQAVRFGNVAAPLEIALAAPTGKAAQRLAQSLQLGRLRMLAVPQAGDVLPIPMSIWQPLLQTVPDDASTLHRLLGYQPHRNAFRHGASHPLAADVVVVDETSMLDLAVLRRLLAALKPGASLVLVGDADQLTSIGAGSALMDLVAALDDGSGDMVRLHHGFRADAILGALNDAVRDGDRAAFDATIASAGTRATRRRVADVPSLALELRRWTTAIVDDPALRPTVPAGDPGAPSDATQAVVLSALAALAHRQLLCALREGDFGAVAIDAAIDRRLRRAWGTGDAAWYPGRAILINHNDPVSRLSNGDIGLCLADADGRLRVWFAGVDGAAVRAFDPQALPAHDGAFAITIHKSQGSEYDVVAVLLPPDPDHRILSRQLLYTGLSRAKGTVELWATDGAVAAALARPIRRAGGLAERLGAAD